MKRIGSAQVMPAGSWCWEPDGGINSQRCIFLTRLQVQLKLQRETPNHFETGNESRFHGAYLDLTKVLYITARLRRSSLLSRQELLTSLAKTTAAQFIGLLVH